MERADWAHEVRGLIAGRVDGLRFSIEDVVANGIAAGCDDTMLRRVLRLAHEDHPTVEHLAVVKSSLIQKLFRLINRSAKGKREEKENQKWLRVH